MFMQIYNLPLILQSRYSRFDL